MISDGRVTPDQQMQYGLEGIAGLRHGEAAGLRWKDYRRDMLPLPGLSIIMAYRRPRPKKGVRRMPVHPTLQAMLDAWWGSGWEAMMGRAPTPKDLIIPMPPEHSARRRTKRGDPMRDKTYSFKRLRSDLVALALRHRRGHDLRRTMISLARTDGAREDLVSRCTHNPRGTSDSIDVDSIFEWAPLAPKSPSCGSIASPLPCRRKTRGRAPQMQQARPGTRSSLLHPLLQSASKRLETRGPKGGGAGSRTRVRKCSTMTSTRHSR
jgi:hypothetical protein